MYGWRIHSKKQGKHMMLVAPCNGCGESIVRRKTRVKTSGGKRLCKKCSVSKIQAKKHYIERLEKKVIIANKIIECYVNKDLKNAKLLTKDLRSLN